MEAEGSLPHSQQPATSLYSEPDQSSPCPPHPVLKIHFNIIFPSMPGSPKWSLSLRFSHQNPVYASPLPHSHKGDNKGDNDNNNNNDNVSNLTVHTVQ